MLESSCYKHCRVKAFEVEALKCISATNFLPAAWGGLYLYSQHLRRQRKTTFCRPLLHCKSWASLGYVRLCLCIFPLLRAYLFWKQKGNRLLHWWVRSPSVVLLFFLCDRKTMRAMFCPLSTFKWSLGRKEKVGLRLGSSCLSSEVHPHIRM